jgi:putative ABC transport system permease protein
MFKNFFKISWRNIIKNWTYSALNVLGLSVSIAFCLLLFFYIKYEKSFDRFHEKEPRLYRLEMTNIFAGSDDTVKKTGAFSFSNEYDQMKNQLTFPLVIGAAMQNTFPEIRSITRFQDAGEYVTLANNQTFKEDHVVFADNNFFNNFSFHFLIGNPKDALKSPFNVVISAAVSKKYFAYANPVGSTIKLITDTTQVYTVSAVVADAPENSSIQYSLIVPLVSDPGYQDYMSQGFNQSSHFYVIELADKVDYRKFETKMNNWVVDYYTKPLEVLYGKMLNNYDFQKFRWFLRPLAEAHYNASVGWGHYTDRRKIYQLYCLIIVILSIAALNYILLSISNVAARTQEVGVRKVMGANRISIVSQFWIETLIITSAAIIIGFMVMLISLPAFNKVMDAHITLFHFPLIGILTALLLFDLFLSIVAGYYPALLLTKLRLPSIAKRFQKASLHPYLSKTMIVVQYSSCVVLIVAAFVIRRQMEFIESKDLGFNKDQVLIVNNPRWEPDYTKKVIGRLEEFAKSQPAIVDFSGMNGGLDGKYITSGFKLNGMQQSRKEISVYYDYFKLLNIKFTQGRPFLRKFSSDTAKKIMPCIVNQTLFTLLGNEAKLGEYNKSLHATIIGVVKDYNFESLSKKMEPQEHKLVTNHLSKFMFKVRAGQMMYVIESLESQWKRISDNYPLEYTFLDQNIAKMYEADLRWQGIIRASSFFAIFVACLGLFGLSAINATNRLKEVGIRKALGATPKDIVVSLSEGFMSLVLISIAIGVPVSWWAMNKWLEDFAYRTSVGWYTLAIAAIVAFLIALFAISLQAIKAAFTNPINALRTE